MLTVSLKTTDPDYTTTGELKARLFGTTSTSTGSDALLSGIIRAASRWADGFVGYPMALQRYDELVPTFGRRNLMLARTPVRSLNVYESTEDDAYEVTSTQFHVEDRDAGLISREDGWPWTVPTELELEERPLPGEESQPWYVVYEAGYTYAGLSTDSPHYSTAAGTTDTGRTLPEDVEEAVLVKCRLIYEESVEGGQVESEQLGDLRTNYRSGGTDRGGGRPSPLGLHELLLGPYARVV